MSRERVARTFDTLPSGQIATDLTHYPDLKTLLKPTLVIIACAGAVLTLMLTLMLGYSHLQHRGDAISANFICVTNHPWVGLPADLVLVTNQSDHIIWCEGYGFLEPGESCAAHILVFTQSDSDRVSVKWQCHDLSKVDGFMNRMRRRAEVFGVKPLRDPWFPPMRVSRISRSATRGKVEGHQNSRPPLQSEMHPKP